MSASAPPATPARASLVWGMGVVAYTAAVLQRTSLGVAGLEAADRFAAPASVVSTFVVVQLLVYALAQIPAGVLLDRFGPRATITAGALLMATGQLALAHADTVSLAIGARILVGAGDALTFGSAIRLVPAWFPAARVPIMTQLTGMLGQVGQLLSAIPFVALLHAQGWTAAFTSIAAISGAVAVASLALVRSTPPGVSRARTRQHVRRIPLVIGRILRHPATQLGFWAHWASGFPGIVFALMWGFPYLTAGEGRPVAVASVLMTVLVSATMMAGPLVGALSQRHPLRRSNLLLLVIAATFVPLLAVVVWPGPAPLWLLVLLVIGLGAGGPASSVGFDFPRAHLASHRLGTATGVVIMGGFTGGLLGVLGVGLVLDALRPDGAYDLAAYRGAFAIMLPMQALGVALMLHARARLRRRMAAAGLSVPSSREVVRSGRIRHL